MKTSPPEPHHGVVKRTHELTALNNLSYNYSGETQQKANRLQRAITNNAIATDDIDMTDGPIVNDGDGMIDNPNAVANIASRTSISRNDAYDGNNNTTDISATPSPSLAPSPFVNAGGILAGSYVERGGSIIMSRVSDCPLPPPLLTIKDGATDYNAMVSRRDAYVHSI